MEINQLSPGQSLYATVRAGFIVRGTTLNAWCRENDVARPTVVAALMGTWNGPKGRAMRERVVVASGISGQTSIRL